MIGVISVNGGTTPYSSQTWLLPLTLIPNPNQSGTGLWPGNNVYQVVDAAGCISSITVPITEPSQLVSAINDISHVTCHGLNDGAATMLVNGGTIPYTYQWTDASSQTTATASNLAAGTYICNVNDANGCSTSQAVIINQPLPLQITQNNVSQILCNGDASGAISVSTSGGTPSYSYSWSPSVGVGPVVTNLIPGTYSLTVTDNHACTASYTAAITQPLPFNVVSTVMPSRCSLPNASISLLVTGATAPYTYQWNDPVLQTTSSAQNLAAPGTYNCLITDANGCTYSINESPTDLPAPIISNITVTHVSCYNGNDGTLTVTAQSGGSSNYTYAWYNTSNVLVGNGSFQGGLPVGTYQIVITDANGCTVSGNASITQPFPLTVSVSPNL
ncbi:MAG: SprB repeat-containing protein, partial [Bacteroidia bacterium]